MNQTASLVEITDAAFSYGTAPVIERVNLSIYPQDFLGLIGPNGGGKTTLLKLILGLLTPTSGDIKIFNTSPKKGRKHIGYVPQVTSFDFNFPISVLEVALMGRLSHKRLYRKFNSRDYKISRQALRQVGMQQYANKQIGALSGGQMQRVLIARALASKPRLLLLDEPFSNIDSDWQTTFYKMLYKLNRKIAIILVTHDISVLANYVDKIACINRTILHYGSTAEGISKITRIYQSPDYFDSHHTSHK